METRKLLSLLLVMFFCLSLFMVAGCDEPAAPPPDDDDDEVVEPEPEPEPEPTGPVRWTIASGWVAGVYYPLSGAM
ncbi:MAG: hypothetical protein ACQESO_04405, partial [Bacillota bacterium]